MLLKFLCGSAALPLTFHKASDVPLLRSLFDFNGRGANRIAKGKKKKRERLTQDRQKEKKKETKKKTDGTRDAG